MAVRYVLRPLNLWWRYFPQLAALYLLGWLGRKGAIELAAYVGWDNDVWASLIMPFAGLARLGSYVAMFLVLRSAIPALAALPRRSARSVDVFANIIVPFFAIYLAWKLFAEDWLDYETAALDYRVGDAMTRALETGESSGLHPDQLPVSGVTWVIIASALVLRYVLGKFKESLPGWVIAVRVYVDALWVFLTLSFAASQGAGFLINPMGWIAERRIVVWLNTTRADLFSYFQPLETLWDAGWPCCAPRSAAPPSRCCGLPSPGSSTASPCRTGAARPAASSATGPIACSTARRQAGSDSGSEAGASHRQSARR